MMVTTRMKLRMIRRQMKVKPRVDLKIEVLSLEYLEFEMKELNPSDSGHDDLEEVVTTDN